MNPTTPKTDTELLGEVQALPKQFDDFLYFLPDALLEVDILAPRLTYMNRMAYIVFGYTEADFAAGIEISNLFAEGEYERAVEIIKGYVIENQHLKTEYQRSGRQDLYEFLMRKKDGSLFHAETQTSFVLDEKRTPVKTRTIIRDITHRKRMEEELRENEALYHALFEIVPVGLGIADLHGNLLAFNEAMLKPGGYSREDIAKIRNVANLYYDPVERAKALTLAQTQGYLDRYEVKFKREDGSSYDTLLTLRPILIKGQRGWQAVVEDITERKRTEEILRRHREELESRVQQRTAELSRINAEIEQQITERQQAEIALRQKTAELQAVFEAIPDLFFRLDAQGKILQYYAGSASDLYAPPEAFLGKPVEEVLPPPVGPLLHDAIVRVHQSRVPFTTEYSLMIKSDAKIYEARFWPFHETEVITMVRNITERKRIEEALLRREEQYRVLFEDNPSMYFTVDVSGVILSVNRFGAEQLGYQAHELLGQSVLNVFYDEDRLPVQQHLSACLLHPGKIFHWEFRKIRKDGQVIWVKEAARSAQDVEGKTIVLIVCEDITETKQLRQTAERMERLAALGQLSATIAHEIRNPLGSISLNVQFLAGRLEIPEAHKKTLHSIEQGISRIQNIINGILDFSRPAEPALKKTNLHKVLDSSLHSTKHELEPAGILISKNYQATPPYVLLDANLIGQVFVNLFLNAKEAMAPGGKLLIHTAAANDDEITVQIADTGKGIPPDYLEKIYDPFFTTKPDGIGLGLAVVARIVEQHHGRIFVESEVGVGTKFTLILPAAGKHDGL